MFEYQSTAEIDIVRNNTERRGRTRIQPAEELNSILRIYCNDDQKFSPSAIKAIGTAVTKLTDCKMLYTADKELIYHFLKIQNDTLKSQNFAFDIVEIALQILAEPRMPLILYNDEWINNIVNYISDECNETFHKNEKKPQVHKIYSMFKHLSYIANQISLPDSTLYKLISLSLSAYFFSASSPSLQAFSCSLLTVIFKKYPNLRNDIIYEAFGNIEKSQGSIKYISFPQNLRKSISIISNLFIELIQSISCFPCKTEKTIQEIIQLFVQTFISRSKSNSVITKIFEKFVDDISSLLSHPFYPVAKTILKSIIESLFPFVSKKDENTRISVKLICIGLKNILKFSQRAKENIGIVFPKSVLESLVGFPEEKVIELMENPETNISETEEGNCVLLLSPSFPRNPFEELTANFIISLYLQQSTQKTESINNALQANITQWSMKHLTQEEMDNYLLWWKGMLPSNIVFEWTLEIAEQISLHQMCKLPMFSHVHFLVQHLLKGLENKNSSIRSMILRGLASLIEIDPDLLFHPSLVSQINDAFKVSSAPIRDSVLQIISKYIVQNEQSSSPYFSVIINCLTDSSTMVVKRALGTVCQLSKHSDDDSLSKLSFLLSTKLTDEVNNVAKAAKDALVQVLFEDAKDPTFVLANAIAKSSKRPDWFSQFFGTLYEKQKYKDAIEDMIQKSFEKANNEPSYSNCCLVREFCETFPSLCSPYHESIISIINSCVNDNVLCIMLNALNSVLKEITNPNISLFELLMQSIQKFIFSKSALIIRSVIEVASNITAEILTENETLNQTFEYFAKFVINNINIAKQKEFAETAENTKLVNHVCRALYIIGCICMFYNGLNQKRNEQIWKTVQNYFKAPIPKIRSMVLQCACDFCARNPRQIQDSKELLDQAFKLGPPEKLSAVTFLKNLIEEESMPNESGESNEVRPKYSSNLVHEFMSEITNCFGYKNLTIRKTALEFSKVALTYGAINPSIIIPYVISMICSPELSSMAIDTLKVVIYHYVTFFNNRIKDGIKESFQFVINFYGPSFTSLKPDDPTFGIGTLFSILQLPQKSIFVDAFLDTVQESLTANPDPYWINWLVRSLLNFSFDYVGEVMTVVLSLNNSVFSAYINSNYAEAKSIAHKLANQEEILPDCANPCVWYSSCLILMAKQWISKKYQINPKKIKNAEIDKKNPVKISTIQPLSFNSIQIPCQELDTNESLLNLFAQFQSAIKIDRSLDASQSG